MSIVTFWGSGKEQVGKTLSVVAIATNIAIEHNKKILVISASYNNETLKNCYWSEAIAKKNLFTPKEGVEIDNAIEGLAKMIQSNKVSPDIITDHTKVVFKDRLEILLGFDARTSSSSENVAKMYLDIVKLANKYYDIVFVDLDNEINMIGADEILKMSDVIIGMTSQKLSSVKTMSQKKKTLPQSRVLLLIGRYDKKSKYTVKNLTRLIGEKKELLVIPYNTLYFEATQEGNVTDLFLRLRRIEDKTDGNAFFIEQVKKVSQEILNKMEQNKMLR